MRLQMKSQRPELEPRWVAVTEKPCCNYSTLDIFGDGSWEIYDPGCPTFYPVHYRQVVPQAIIAQMAGYLEFSRPAPAPPCRT